MFGEIRARLGTLDGSLERVQQRMAGWRFLQAIHRRLESLPFGGLLGLGLVAGGVFGFVALELGPFGGLGVAIVASLAFVVGLTAQPVWVEDPIEPPESVEPADLFEMVEIEGGTFWMGSSEDEPGRRDNERLHEVTVSGFYIGKTAVTRAQYEEIMETQALGSGGPDHPVTGVSWREAVKFCIRASERAGFEPCYKVDGKNVEWLGGNGYRLPTEDEWEYAARAGTRTRWSFGDDGSELGEHAWFLENANRVVQPVARLKPNPWGLFDMHGNVWEWCWDVYGEYPRKAAEDPRGSNKSSSVLRVLRGGSAWDGPKILRSAFRNWVNPGYRYGGIGFRCLRVAHPQP